MNKVRKKKRRPKPQYLRAVHDFGRICGLVYDLAMKGVFDERRAKVITPGTRDL